MKIPAGNGHDRSVFLSFDALERDCRGWGKPGRTGDCAGCARGALPDLLGVSPRASSVYGGLGSPSAGVYPGQNPLRCRTFTLLAVQRLSALPCEMDFTRVESCQGKDAKQSAIDYAKARATFGRGEIRAVAKHRHVESVI